MRAVAKFGPALLRTGGRNGFDFPTQKTHGYVRYAAPLMVLAHGRWPKKFSEEKRERETHANGNNAPEASDQRHRSTHTDEANERASERAALAEFAFSEKLDHVHTVPVRMSGWASLAPITCCHNLSRQAARGL